MPRLLGQKVKGKVVEKSTIKGKNQSAGMKQKTKVIQTPTGEMITEKTTKYKPGVSNRNLKTKTVVTSNRSGATAVTRATTYKNKR